MRWSASSFINNVWFSISVAKYNFLKVYLWCFYMVFYSNYLCIHIIYILIRIVVASTVYKSLQTIYYTCPNVSLHASYIHCLNETFTIFFSLFPPVNKQMLSQVSIFHATNIFLGQRTLPFIVTSTDFNLFYLQLVYRPNKEDWLFNTAMYLSNSI